jgi:putative hemolysin
VVRFPPIRMLSRGLIGLANMLLGPRGRRVGVSESELLAMADVAHEEDVIEGHERELIHSIIEFGDTVVREVMVPRPDMRTLEADCRCPTLSGGHRGRLQPAAGPRRATSTTSWASPTPRT